jgi:hypothetical protein
MLKQIAAALFAATVIAAPAFAVDTGQSKPAVETSKPAPDAKVQQPRHVRHHLRYHRHVTQAHVKHVKHAKHAASAKKLDKTPAPKSPGQAATAPAPASK